MSLDPRTPVLVGAGSVTIPRVDGPLEPIDLMATALEQAMLDAGADDLEKLVDVVMVPRGMWRYPDPARLVADRFGGTPRTVVAEVGVLQQTLITRACDAVARGDADVVAVVGGEARAQPRREHPPGTGDEGAPADEVLEPHGEILSRHEIDAGLYMPVNQYAVMENALRDTEGMSIENHAREVAGLCAAFSRVAADNPAAWNRAGATVDEIRVPSPANRPLSFPYNKLHVSQWNVNQASALLIIAAGVAEGLGIERDRFVFPLAAAESNAMVPMSARPELHRSPAVEHVGHALEDAVGVRLADVEHLDLYSCFPIAVRIQQRQFGIERTRQQTVTGGMTFGGGPLNNYVLQSTAKMVEVLRADPSATGLVTCVSGMLTKFAGALWSATPPERPFAAIDVTAAVEADMPPRTVGPPRDETSREVGYTITYDGSGAPARRISIVEYADGSRAVVSAPT